MLVASFSVRLSKDGSVQIPREVISAFGRELAPRTTYFALAPFTGSEQAGHVATTEAVG